MEKHDKETRAMRVARAIPGFARLFESTLSLLDQLGLKPWIAGAVLSGLVVAIAWFRDNVQWYVALLLLLAFFALILWIYHRWLLIRATSKWSAKKYREVGRDLVDLSQESFGFLTERARAKAEMHLRDPAGFERTSERWEQDRDFDQITGRLFFERYGPRFLSSLALLRRIGVEVPHGAVTMAGYLPDGIPQFLGTLGGLLAKGYVTDAVDISKDRDFMWRIGH